MRTTRDRQLSMRGDSFCKHPKPEAIHNQGGDLIAEMCRMCGARIAEMGICDGVCGKREPMRLTAFLLNGERPRRFHNESCRQQTIQSETAARAQRTSLSSAGPPPPRSRK